MGKSGAVKKCCLLRVRVVLDMGISQERGNPKEPGGYLVIVEGSWRVLTWGCTGNMLKNSPGCESLLRKPFFSKLWALEVRGS